MGACQSNASKVARQKNDEIEADLKKDADHFKKEAKILLLGSGESGKSTIVRQMKIMHMNGYTQQEAMAFRASIYMNIFTGMMLLNDGIVNKLKIGWSTESSQQACALLLQEFDEMKKLDELKFTKVHAKIVKELWADQSTSDALMRANEFYMLDSTAYYIKEADRVADDDYVPTEQDILRVRIKTTGIVETKFSVSGLNIHMFDVGGQRSERKKWIHCFESVTSVIFFVSLIDYDLTLLEDSSQNRMQESVSLFDSVINSRWFQKSSLILFLNKADAFKEKLDRAPMEKTYEDYNGGNDVTRAAKYILSKFTNVNRAKLKIYPHITCATDTK